MESLSHLSRVHYTFSVYKRTGLLDTLAQMDEATTVYVGLCVPMFVYVICLLTALVLRAITMWIQELNTKKVSDVTNYMIVSFYDKCYILKEKDVSFLQVTCKLLCVFNHSA